MIRGGFLSEEDRKALIALARDGSMVCRVTRRANALVLLDAGKSCRKSPSFSCATTTRSGASTECSSRGVSKPDHIRRGRQFGPDECRTSRGLEGLGERD